MHDPEPLARVTRYRLPVGIAVSPKSCVAVVSLSADHLAESGFVVVESGLGARPWVLGGTGRCVRGWYGDFGISLSDHSG